MFVSCSGLIRSSLAPINPQQHRTQLKSHIGFPAICCTNRQNFNSVPITARVSCKDWGTFCMPAAAKHIYNWLLFEREKFFFPSSFTLSLAIWGERIHHTFCCLYPSHKAGFHGHWKPRKSGNFLLRGNTTLNCEASTNEMKPRLEILKKCLADMGPCTAFEHKKRNNKKIASLIQILQEFFWMGGLLVEHLNSTGLPRLVSIACHI